MNTRRNAEFDRLLGELLDGSLDADQHRALRQMLRTDDQLRQRYLDLCQMHAMLRHEQGLLAGCEDVAENEVCQDANDVGEGLNEGQGVLRFLRATGVLRNEPAPQDGSPRRLAADGGWQRRVLAGVAAASLVVFFFSLPLWLWWLAGHGKESPLPHRGPTVARLTGTVGAQFAYGINGDPSPAVGSAMPTGHYEVQGGLVQLDFDSGARVVIENVESAARFQLVGPEKMILLDGRLSAHVPPSAIGFAVETPGINVVDFGTDFGVNVEPGRYAEVHVFEGEVEVRPRQFGGLYSAPVQLFTGQASRIDERTGVPAGIDLASLQFVQALDEPASASGRYVLELEPAVYYRMEPADDGLTLYDASGNGAHGHVETGFVRGGVWAAGQIGTALRLGGAAVQRYAIVPSYPQTDGNALSVIAWVYAESRPRWASIAKNWATPNRGQFNFGLRGDRGTLECHIIDGHGEKVSVEEQEQLPIGQWHHVALVADGRYLRLYRNGQEVDAATYEGLHRNPEATALGIGARLNASADATKRTDLSFWDGRLDEIAIFNHALSADQIRQLYELGNSQ